MKKGTYVSRSAYQKVCEENKKLIADLRIICMMDSEEDKEEAMKVIRKWRVHFKTNLELISMLKLIAREAKNLDK